MKVFIATEPVDSPHDCIARLREALSQLGYPYKFYLIGETGIDWEEVVLNKMDGLADPDRFPSD